MKSTRIILALSFAAVSSTAYAFDRQTVDALHLCHDYLWDVPAFQNLPNAAISVFPGMATGDTVVVNWNVSWNQPAIRAAGNCTVINGAMEGFEDYTDQ